MSKHVIDVYLEFSPHQDEMQIVLRTQDGSKLTAQSITDAVLEALLLEYGVDRASSRKFDS